MQRSLAYQLSSLLAAAQHCAGEADRLARSGHESSADHFATQAAEHLANLAALCEDHLPHGSGFDAGSQLDTRASNPERLVFLTSFHHMDENGTYDGWTDHTVTVRPSFTGFDVKVSGRDRNDIRDYIAELFCDVLAAEVDASTFYRPANDPSASR